MTSHPGSVRLRRGLLLIWAGLVALITLVPGAEGSGLGSDPSLCLFCGSRGTADAILNIVFFMPFGFLLAPGASVGRVALLGLGLSIGIEVAQEILPGRYSTLGDLVWNATGALLGAVVARVLSRELGAGATGSAGWPAGTAVALPILYLAGAGLLLTPLPTDARYYGQWTADLDFLPIYRGEALAISSQQGVLPDGPMPPGQDLRMDGPWFLEARIVKGPAPSGPAPVASIYDEEKREIALLAIHREDLVWREWTLGDLLRFDEPDRRVLEGLAPYAEGDTVRIAASGEGTVRCLAVGEREDCGGGVTPGRTWGLLLFVESPPERYRRILDFGWIATLTVLVGVLGGPPGRTALLALGTAAGVAAVVGSTRLIAPPAWQWLGFAAGVGTGVVLRPLLRRLTE